MKVKRNRLTMALVLVLGLTLFTAATVAASSTNVGYETFKTTMEEINHEEASSGQIQVKVTDNGEEVFNLKAEAVGNKEDHNFSAQASLDDGEINKSFEIYGQDDSVYIIDLLEDGYYQIMPSDDTESRFDDKEGHDREMTAVEEELMDYFVGDLKENFVVNDLSDGAKVLSFNMEASEVPTGLNLLIKAATSAEGRTEDKRQDQMSSMPFMDGFATDQVADLVDDVQIELVSLDLQVDAKDQLTEMHTKLSFSGKDADGVSHVIVAEIDLVMDYEEVEVKTIDTEAYDWELVEGRASDDQGRASKKRMR